MRLATVLVPDGPTTAAVDLDGAWHALPYTDVSELLRDPNWRQMLDHAAHQAPVQDPVLTLPLPTPGKVICCGHNYAEHIAELGNEPPRFPALFAKFAETLCGPSDDILIGGMSDRVDWEAELAVVVGRQITRSSTDEARSAIAGYTVANDISLRDWQHRTSQWLQGKSVDATTPLGPVVVTPDEVDPVTGLRVTCTLNGELMQEGNTSTLVFGAAELVAYVSQFTTLRPGDIILTGTPGGVGMAMDPPRFIPDGAVLSTSIAGIGTLHNRVFLTKQGATP